jgi:hypothetical protein
MLFKAAVPTEVGAVVCHPTMYDTLVMVTPLLAAIRLGGVMSQITDQAFAAAELVPCRTEFPVWALITLASAAAPVPAPAFAAHVPVVSVSPHCPAPRSSTRP